MNTNFPLKTSPQKGQEKNLPQNSVASLQKMAEVWSCVELLVVDPKVTHPGNVHVHQQMLQTHKCQASILVHTKELALSSFHC